MTKAEQIKIDKMKKDNGKLFVIAVGISDYDNKADNLNNCCNDARSIFDTFKDKEYFNMDSNSVLINSDAERTSKSALISRIIACDKFIDNNTNIIFYYSGHGCNIDDQFHFWVSDSSIPNINTISIKELTDILSNLNSGRHKSITILIDACQQIIGHRKGLQSYSDKFISEYLKNAKGLGIIYSCSKGEYSLDEYNEHEISVFTYLILQALHGNSSAVDANYLTFSSLYNFLQLESRKISRECMQINQHPIVTFDGSDIVYSYIPSDNIQDKKIVIDSKTYDDMFNTEIYWMQNIASILYMDKGLTSEYHSDRLFSAPSIPFIRDVCAELTRLKYLHPTPYDDVLDKATTYSTLIEMNSSDTLPPALKNKIINSVCILNACLDGVYD